jgi:hypothetical protein
MCDVNPAELRRWILDGANPSGGWGYHAGRASRIEPTCWALLALGATAGRRQEDTRPHVDYLRSLQRPGGELVEPSSPGPNYAWNALALVALARLPGGLEVTERLRPALLAAKGIQLPGESQAVPIDGRLQAWSWIEGTFSWVEPTAWAVLALQQPSPSPALAARLTEATAMLVDRACPGGGWNYGNGRVLGQDLRPYVPTTALTLLALQSRRDLPAFVSGLGWLEAHATRESSSMALSLTSICLRVCDRPGDAVLTALAAQGKKTAFLENVHLGAMALYAATIDDHGAQAFRVAA